jgi:hypothetical protein
MVDGRPKGTERVDSACSAWFRTRSTTRASLTSAVAMSDPEARINKAGVIIALMIACAAVMCQPLIVS